MEFQKAFLDKLGSLNGTQVSIQTLSSWLIQNKATVKHVGKIWYKELKKVHRKRKLTLLYLMNDVVQNSRKQGPEFQRVFAAVLIHAIKDCAKSADAKMFSSLDRLLRIWQERRVFELELLQRCRQMLDKFQPRGGAGGVGSGGGARTSDASTSAAAAGTGAGQEASGGAKGGGRSTTAVGIEDDDDDDEEEAEEGSDSSQDISVGPALCDAGVGSDDDSNDDAVAASAGNQAIASRGSVGNGGGGGGVPTGVGGVAGGVGALRAELAAQMELERTAADLPDSDRILAELQFLAAAPSGSAEMRRRISRFPKHIVEEASVDQCRSRKECQRLLREVAQADEVCSAYNQQLGGEVDRRRAFHADLRAYCRGQRAALAIGRTQLEAQRRRLRELRALRQELAGHLANLPDLATLPAVSGGGLAPLPSVGDLFS